jgi:hypothetical protein
MLKTTRRRLLTVGVAGTALLGGGGLLSWLTRGYALAVDDDPPVVLSVKELCVVRAIVEALAPADGALPSGVGLKVHRRIDEELFAQPTATQQDLKAAIQLLEHAPPLMGHAARLSALPVEARAAVFLRLMTSGPDVVVQAAASLRQLVGVFCFGHPQSWGAIGYDGPWQREPKPPPSQAAYEAAVARLVAGSSSRVGGRHG